MLTIELVHLINRNKQVFISTLQSIQDHCHWRNSSQEIPRSNQKFFPPRDCQNTRKNDPFQYGTMAEKVRAPCDSIEVCVGNNFPRKSVQKGTEDVVEGTCRGMRKTPDAEFRPLRRRYNLVAMCPLRMSATRAKRSAETQKGAAQRTSKSARTPPNTSLVIVVVCSGVVLVCGGVVVCVLFYC